MTAAVVITVVCCAALAAVTFLCVSIIDGVREGFVEAMITVRRESDAIRTSSNQEAANERSESAETS